VSLSSIVNRRDRVLVPTLLRLELRGYTHLRDFDTLVSRVYELECLVSAMFRGEHLNMPENAGAGGMIPSGTRSVRFASGLDGPNAQATRQDSFFDEPLADPGFQVDEMEDTWNNTGHNRTYQHNTGNSMIKDRRPRPAFSRQNTNNSLDPNLNIPGRSDHMHLPQPQPPSSISPPFGMNWDRSTDLHPRNLAGPSAQSSEPVSKAPSLTEHDAALLLEDMVYDRKVMRDGNAGLPGKYLYQSCVI
jgi:hypothetical protein